MTKPTMLIVEDSLEQMKRCLELATDAGYECRGVHSLDDAIKHLESKAIDVLLTDIHLQGALQNTFEGLKLLEHIKTEYPGILSIVMSSDPNLSTYEKALALGANHFLRKPILNSDELQIGIELAKSRRNMKNAAKKISKSKLPREVLAYSQDGVILPQKIRDMASRIARHRKTSSILMGETGSGKEEVAKLIHRMRADAEGPIPYVAVNCATLNGDIGTSLLFGHRKGAFTGADQTTNGFVGEANGGILFLDEVHTLSIECQQRLLRVLSDGTYERVGESKPMKSDFQLLSASSVDLSDAVDSGKLVEDLYMRLSGANISIPPLRERPDEIPLLVALYFSREGIDLPSSQITKISDKCKTLKWRGNVRQLFRSLQTLVVMAGSELQEINAENLLETGELTRSNEKKLKDLVGKLSAIDPKDFDKVVSALVTDLPIEVAVDNFEKLFLQCALNRHEKLIDVINAISISRSGLDGKRKKYSI